MNTAQIIDKAMVATEKAGAFLLESARKIQKSDIEVKGSNDFVTYVDKTAENMLLEELSSILPGSSFIAEESGISEKRGEFTWIIDPLDGTTNYIHHVPLYSISIGLMKGDELVGGIIYEPNAKEMFHAVKGEGAFLNNSKIAVTQNPKMADSLWATGFPYHQFEKLGEYMNFIAWSMQHTHGLRRLGSAAVDMAWVACGRLDGFFEFGLKPWDVAAGTILIEEAGGKVTDFSGGDKHIFNQELIASNPYIYEEFFKNFHEIFFRK
ncbi:MAG: inositol monophosphatase [Marinilabiliales bacterium]|nr:MAG: inositol monophosphatase [Marinilabiliales bacterium]